MKSEIFVKASAVFQQTVGNKKLLAEPLHLEGVSIFTREDDRGGRSRDC